jgi:hypothetical protein
VYCKQKRRCRACPNGEILKCGMLVCLGACSGLTPAFRRYIRRRGVEWFEIVLFGRNGVGLYTSKAAARPPHSQFWRRQGYTRGGNADVCERKGLAGKAICKTMRTKGEQTGFGAER